MKYLSGEEEKQARIFLDEAADVARGSTCKRARCGSVIVNDGEVIGAGFNSPPGDNESQRRCHIKKDTYHKKVTDKTCCIHAEQRAIMNALKRNHEKLHGARMYFIRFDKEGNERPLDEHWKPYCTICSKMALDSGISDFVLAHKDGILIYNMEEYNDISFQFNSEE